MSFQNLNLKTHRKNLQTLLLQTLLWGNVRVHSKVVDLFFQ